MTDQMAINWLEMLELWFNQTSYSTSNTIRNRLSDVNKSYAFATFIYSYAFIWDLLEDNYVIFIQQTLQTPPPEHQYLFRCYEESTVKQGVHAFCNFLQDELEHKGFTGIIIRPQNILGTARKIFNLLEVEYLVERSFIQTNHNHEQWLQINSSPLGEYFKRNSD
jgi:hypothetical protein